MATTTTAPSRPAAITPTDVVPSPAWGRAMASGPDSQVKITAGYARLVARTAYFWAWPMVNIYNRRLAFDQCPEPGLMNGVLPFAPLNALSMLSDYIQPEHMVPLRYDVRPKGRSVSLRLSEELLEAVKTRARDEGMPYQRFIRLALEEALARGLVARVL